MQWPDLNRLQKTITTAREKQSLNNWQKTHAEQRCSGRALLAGRQWVIDLTESRPVRENGPAGRNLFCRDDGRPRNICLVLSLFFSLCSSDGNCVHGPPRIESTPDRRHGARWHHDATMSSATATANNEDETPHFFVNICNELHNAHRAGIEEALFRSFFDVHGSTQIQCASGPDHCTHSLPVDGSVHCCMNCGLKYHSSLTCCVETLSYCFSVRDSGLVAPMLSPYGQERLGQSSLEQFNICRLCQERLRPILDGVSEGVPSDGVQEGVPLLPPIIVPKTSTRSKKRVKVVFHYRSTLLR
jgi:hypothetical protein